MPTERPRRARPYRLLAGLPALLILGGVPFANRVHALVLGLPFLLTWILGCVLLTAALMAVIGSLDRRRDAEEAAGSGGSAGDRRGPNA